MGRKVAVAAVTAATAEGYGSGIALRSWAAFVTSEPDPSAVGQGGASREERAVRAKFKALQGTEPPPLAEELDPKAKARKRRRFDRMYFYYVDHVGHVVLRDARVRNFVSAIKDKDFLDFFLMRVRPNTTGLWEDRFEYVSPCGRELNFIEVDDTPIVFGRLVQDDADQHVLTWAGTQGMPFQPAALRFDLETGRLFHPAPSAPKMTLKMPWALIGAHLASSLAESIVFDADGSAALSWGGESHPITVIDGSPGEEVPAEP